MKGRFAPLSLLLLAGVVGLSHAAKPAQWVEVRSQHFHVLSDAKPKKVRQLTEKLERYRHLLTLLFPGLRYDSPAPTRVFLFKNDESYKPYEPLTPDGKPMDMAGFMQPGPERMYVVVNLSEYESEYVLFHEYIHVVMRRTFQDVPVWLNEGLAEFFEQTTLKRDGRFVLGQWQRQHWNLLKRYDLIPLDVLLAVHRQSEHYLPGQKRNLFYAQSWLLVHYLMVADEGKRQGQLNRFVQLLLQGNPQETSFRQAFGTDYPGMHRQLRDYLMRRSLTRYEGKVTNPLALELAEPTPIPERVARAYATDIWLNTQRVEEAEQALQQLAASEPAPPEVLFRLGRLALLRGQMEEAEKHFLGALESDPDDLSLRYYAAQAVSRGRLVWASGEEKNRAAAQILELLSPILKEPEKFPDAYRLVVETRLARNDPPAEMIPVLEQARRIPSLRGVFDLLLADTYIREKRWGEAEALLREVARESDHAYEREQAEEWLREVRAARAGRPLPAGGAPGGDETLPEPVARVHRPVEPQPPPQPGSPPKVSYAQGTLVNVACASDDSAVVTVATETEAGAQPETIHLAVRSLSRVLLLDPTESGEKLECGPSGLPVGINYRVEPQGPNVAGVVMTIELYPPEP